MHPIACLYGPRFLMAWNIHVSCATWGIAMHGVAMHVIATQGIHLGKY